MIEDTIKERTESYGDFADNATVAQLLKEAIQMETNYPNMPPYMRESLDIICSKISRMVTGDWKHADNWLDIQGFAKLSLDLLNNETRPESNEDHLPTEPLPFSEWEAWQTSFYGCRPLFMREMYKEYLKGFTATRPTFIAPDGSF